MATKTGKPSSACPAVVLAAALLAATLLLATVVDAGPCGVEVSDVVKNCKDYVKKGSKRADPSQQCCNAIKGADIKCACQKLLTPDVQSLLDMNNAVYVGRKCGLNIPTGTKCGDYVVNN